MVKEKGNLMLAIAVVVGFTVVIITGLYLIYDKSLFIKEKEQKQENTVVCAQDAKVCPDGSSVGRIGPNCEFADCPVVVDQTAGWQTYRNNEYGFEFKYPEKLNSKFFSLLEPQAIISNQQDEENIKDGYYMGSVMSPNPLKKEKVLINNMEFCVLQTYDAGAGSGRKYYFYTVFRNGNYFTIGYIIGQPNSCGNYYDTPNYEPCEEEFKNYQNIVEKLINDSISTFKFISVK